MNSPKKRRDSSSPKGLVVTVMRGHNRTRVLLALKGTPKARRRGSTHPDRISFMRNVETPMGPVVYEIVGRPQGKLNSPAGTGRIEKQMPVAERQGKTITRRIGSYGPTRKGADAILVSRPKYAVMEANRGES